MKIIELPNGKIPKVLPGKHLASERFSLYELILHALNESKKKRTITSRIAEVNRNAELLHERGMGTHALHMLKRGKKMGIQHQELGSVLRTLDLEQEIFRTHPSSTWLLGAARESLKVLEEMKLSITWKEFYLRVHVLALEYAKSQNSEVMEVLQSMIRIQPERALFTWPFYAKLYHAFAFADYFQLVQDTWNSSIHLRAALEQLLSYPSVAGRQPGLLLSTSSGLMGTLLSLGEYEQVLDLSSRLRALAGDIFNVKERPLKVQLFADTEPYELEALTRLKRLEEAGKVAGRIEVSLKSYATEIGGMEMLVILRALAKAYYASQDPEGAFRCLSRVFMDERGKHSQENIFYLVLFYELKKFEELADMVAKMRRQLISQKRLHKTEFIMMELFMKLSRTAVTRDHLFFFEEAMHELMNMELDHNYRKSIAVFDFREWISEKIKSR